MNDSNQRSAGREGKPALSTDPLTDGGVAKITLGDIADLRAYVGKVARTITRDEDELEDLIGEGITVAVELHAGLGPRESLEQALRASLESRLRDRWRKDHREWRRNSRGATSYSLPRPTGLSWEHDAGMTAGMPAFDEQLIIESRLDLRLFTSAADLRNPRTMGRYNRVPSHAGLATAASEKHWAEIQAERDITNRKPFRFNNDDL